MGDVSVKELCIALVGKAKDIPTESGETLRIALAKVVETVREYNRRP
jgi:hypothetical protein